MHVLPSNMERRQKEEMAHERERQREAGTEKHRSLTKLEILLLLELLLFFNHAFNFSLGEM